ncbi:MAG: DUF1285 domain-containing protein [Pseudomonadota bacterium]
MSDLMRYAAALDDVAGQKLPPVDKWTPDYCGEIDLIITRDGHWVHEGTPIGRPKLVRLLSTIIRLEADGYYLVTPVEKLRFEVEDAPFVAVLMETETETQTGEGEAALAFTTNVGDRIIAGPDHAISMKPDLAGDAMAPYIHVRAGLEARVARSVFYELVDIAEVREVDGVRSLGVSSKGAFFPLGPAPD